MMAREDILESFRIPFVPTSACMRCLVEQRPGLEKARAPTRPLGKEAEVRALEKGALAETACGLGPAYAKWKIQRDVFSRFDLGFCPPKRQHVRL